MAAPSANRGGRRCLPSIWFTDEALAGWKAQPRTTPGGQPHYSDLAFETALTLRAVFRLALRQSEGLIGSIMRMLEIDLPVPDHTTLSRRACGLPVPERARIGAGDLHLIVDSTGLKLRGAGEWLFEFSDVQTAIRTWFGPWPTLSVAIASSPQAATPRHVFGTPEPARASPIAVVIPVRLSAQYSALMELVS